jgi:hypothetical protein
VAPTTVLLGMQPRWWHSPPTSFALDADDAEPGVEQAAGDLAAPGPGPITTTSVSMRAPRVLRARSMRPLPGPLFNVTGAQSR